MRDYHRAMSDNRGIKTSPNFNVELISSSRVSVGRTSDEWSGISQRSRSPSTGSRLSTCSSEVVEPYAIIESGEIELEYGFKEDIDIRHTSPPSVLVCVMIPSFYESILHDEICLY